MARPAPPDHSADPSPEIHQRGLAGVSAVLWCEAAKQLSYRTRAHRSGCPDEPLTARLDYPAAQRPASAGCDRSLTVAARFPWPNVRGNTRRRVTMGE